MTANVESMLYQGEVPWHGVGTKLEGQVSSALAIKEADLDWDVEVAPIVTDDHKKTGVDRYRVTRRVTDNTILGIVKRGYVPIQNREAFMMFDNVVGAGKADYNTAGSLEGGSKVFMSMKLPEPMVIGKGVGVEDVVDRYLLLSNAHDGTRPLQMIFTPVRVVCSNTLGIALFEKNGDKVTATAPRVSIKHNKDAKKLIKQSEMLMAKAYKYYQKFGEFADFMYRTQVSEETIDNIVAAVFPENSMGVVTDTAFEHRSQVTRLFEEGIGHELIAGSAWALFNAFTEYADHHFAKINAKTPEARSYNVMLGKANGLKTRATRAIVESLT